jgi:hypothetical protein
MKTTTTPRLFQNDDRARIFLNPTVDSGPIGQIIQLMVLIVLFSLSLVVSVISAILFIIVVIIGSVQFVINSILDTINNDDDDDGSSGGEGGTIFFLTLYLAAAVFSPLLIVTGIIATIVSLVANILDPFLPNNPTSTPVASSFQQTMPTFSPSGPSPITTVTSPQYEATTNVMYHLLAVLGSPIDTITAVLLPKESTIRNMDQNDKNDMDCEIVALACKDNALLDAMPF